ncbi:MAG: DUF1552 domain-containing protein [Pirellulales bacterium]
MTSRDSNRFTISRRNVLRGLGITLALPLFESSMGSRSFAAESKAGLAVTPGGAPLRMAFMSIPNGVQQKHWFPLGEGRDYRFNTTMEPLESVKEHVQVIAGLKHENATPGADGAGDHARASATFLTGARARKTAGRDIFVGVSVDQRAASHIQDLTRFPSLELSCDAIRNSGGCDSGYACAYQYNLAWSSPTTPVTPDPNPRSVFERLFGSGSKEDRAKNYALRQETQRSILDFVMEDAAQVQRQLGGNDRRKLDEYLSGVREIEQRVARADKFGTIPNPEFETPAGIPAAFAEHIDVMLDILALAFQSDTTRVATLLMAYDGSNRIFPEIGIAEGHHHLTHNQDQPELAEKVAAIDRFYMQRFASFLERLDKMQDSDGRSVLYNSMIVYGGAIADGNRHSHDNLPVVLAGRAGGRIESNRYLQAPVQPMSNLFVSMLNHFGVPTESFGDSTGRLEKF